MFLRTTDAVFKLNYNVLISRLNVASLRRQGLNRVDTLIEKMQWKPALQPLYTRGNK